MGRKSKCCKSKHESESCSKKEYDYIIIGDGAAGSLMARKLSDPITNGNCVKNPRVLVLERGANEIQQFGYPTNPLILDTKLFVASAFVNPSSTLRQLTDNPLYAQKYTVSLNSTTSNPLLLPRTYSYSTGNGWGGGSSHFYMVAYRGSKHVWDEYAAINANSTWSYNALLPVFKAIETYTPNTGGCFDPTQRGSNGPISIIQSTPGSVVAAEPVLNAFATAPNVSVGFCCDQNSATQPAIGVSSFQAYQTTPVANSVGQYRSWSHNSFLPIGTIINTDGQGLNGRKLTIKSNSLVNRILFQGTKAVGVEYISTVTSETIQVFGKQIILAAGAIQDPMILQRSGVGDATLLSSLGIPVVLANSNVGAHMNGTTNALVLYSGTTFGLPAAIVNMDLHDTSLPISDPFYYPADGVRRIYNIIFDGSIFNVPGKVGSNLGVCRSNYDGTIQITSTNPTIAPVINIDLFGDDTTGLVNGSALNKLMAATRIVEKAVTTIGATMFSPTSAVISNDGLLRDFFLKGANIQSHQLGTCRFGTSAATAVVDSRLNIFGLQNLKIADLSIYPYTIDGNPMTSAIIAGLKCVESFGVPLNPIL